jgi:predicted RNA polymerase sigma factor
MLARVGQIQAAVDSYETALLTTDKQKEVVFYQGKITQLMDQQHV